MLTRYELKGIGVPKYYTGADMSYDQEQRCWKMSNQTYVKTVTDQIEKLLNVQLKSYATPMEANDHPELDESELIPDDQIAQYKMLIGCAQWAITLGRYDIQYVTNILAKYGSMPSDKFPAIMMCEEL